MTNSFDHAVFLTYTLPEDALARGYENWLRDVDNPFFNAIPGVGRYENWRIARAVRKHYAIGAAPAGESWLVDIDRHPGPGFRWLSVATVDTADAFDRIVFCGNDTLCAEATLIAAPP